MTIHSKITVGDSFVPTAEQQSTIPKEESSIIQATKGLLGGNSDSVTVLTEKDVAQITNRETSTIEELENTENSFRKEFCGIPRDRVT